MQNYVGIALQRYRNVHRFDDSRIYSHCNLEQDIPCIYQKRHFASTRSRHEERNVLHFPPTYNSKLDTVLEGLVSLLRHFYQRPSKKLEAL